MSEKKLTVEEAEAALLALEKPGHDVALANIALRRAESDGDTNAIRAALDKYRAALLAQEAAGITPMQIALAAQDVLDARGEAHSETNILPPDHGIATVMAGRALAMAQGDRNPKQIAAAQKDLADAEAEDEAAKVAHVAEAHRRTVAAQIAGGN